jgi:hypothetical protein
MIKLSDAPGVAESALLVCLGVNVGCLADGDRSGAVERLDLRPARLPRLPEAVVVLNGVLAADMADTTGLEPTFMPSATMASTDPCRLTALRMIRSSVEVIATLFMFTPLNIDKLEPILLRLRALAMCGAAGPIPIMAFDAMSNVFLRMIAASARFSCSIC